MSDNGMLSLFDTDGGFLEDLATDNGLAGTGSLLDAGGILGQMNPVMNTQPQQPQMFNQQMGGMQTNQFNNMQMQPPNVAQQNQFMTNTFNQQQNQFNTTKLHHFGGQQQQPGTAAHVMVLQQNNQSMAQRAPMQVIRTNMQPSPGFQNYGSMTTANGPRLPNPHQQQIGIQQNMPRMWNPNQNGPSQQAYVQQLPNQQPRLQNIQQIPGNGLQTTYLTQHNYALSKDNNIPQNRYQDGMPSTPNANVFMQGMKSPTGNMRPNVPMSSPNNNLIKNVTNISQSPRPPQQQMMINRTSTFQTQQNINSVNIPNFSSSQQQVQQPFQNSFNLPNIQNVGQINAGSVNVPSSSFQQFTYQQPQQQMPNQNTMASEMQMSQNINDKSSNMIPFQNTSPNQNVQFRPTYTVGTPQRTITPSASPRPTPSPARTPDLNAHTSPNSQGNLNQLVSPTMVSRPNTTPASSPFHVPNRSDANIAVSQAQILTNSFGNISNTNTVSVNNQSNTLPNQLVSVSVGQTNLNSMGQMSPSVGQVKNVNVEIYQLQQQIQQLHNQPQTQQTQQQMLDLQERVRTLRAQQELNSQRQKQQAAQSFPTYQIQNQQMQPSPQRPAIIQVQQPQLQPRQQIVQIQQPFPNQQQPIQQQQMQPQGQRILLVSNNMAGQPQRFLQTMSQAPGQQFVQQPQQKVVLIQQQQAQPGQQIRLIAQGQPQNQMPPSSMAMGSGNVPMSVVQIQLPQKTDILPKLEDDEEGGDKSVQKVKAQEKANQIVAEAVAKAQAAGNTQIPKVMTPPPIPSTVGDAEAPGSEEDGKKKSAKKRPKKKGKASKDKKEFDDDGESKEKKSKVERPKSVKKKKKPPATFLKSKKRKRNGSSDGSDVEIKITPPPSPENDEDSGIQKRRSARNTKRKKYLDEVDLNLSDDDTLDVDTEAAVSDTVNATGGAVTKPVPFLSSVETTVAVPLEEESMVVEKILGARMRKLDKDIDVVNDDEEAQPEEEVEEYFVKYKNFSYLHCEWKTITELERDKRIHMKLKRFRAKREHLDLFETVDEDELFNPDYVEVDRVMEVSVTSDPVTEEEVTHFLVKWRGLPYEDSTWELQQDVDPEKVKLFYKFRDPPPEEDREVPARPSRDEWVQIPETKTYKGGNTLREYQLEGVNWLTFNWYKHQNCILADEMGLGKTIQSITFLHEIVEYGIKGPFLVVVPLSTLGNWQREFETWTDMNAIVYHGSNTSKFMLQEYEMFYKDEERQRIPDLTKFTVLVTTFEIIISDCELLSSIDWRCLIIDEAHRLKNKKCKLMEGLRYVDCEHRVLLTGTPLQNNVEELFSLLNFLEPEQFNSSQTFLAEFGNLRTDDQVDKLKALLKPMMLRRLKEDVETSLAAKEETIIEVELTNIQKKYYRAILERNFTFLSKGSTTSANVPNLLNTMMELRKCCNHPYLVKGAEDMIIRETKEKENKPELDMFDIHRLMVQSSGKLVLMDKLLPKLKQGGHKVLIFSQMIKVLDILEDYLIQRRYLYERLDGRITGIMRQEAIDRFSKPDSDRFVFLLCTRAGGLGINLTAADTVIIYDSDWNPQNDLQAQARCHRIGQSKAVKVYRLITRNSYEREMFDRASLKLGLDKAVLQSMGGDKAANPREQLTKKEIEELLRKGAYGALMDDDKAGDDFCEEDIDQILQRRTQVIQIESEGKGSTFSKASFTMSENRDDIDINDPNFWQKWAKKADVNADEDKNELIVEVPRQRKQTARYGNDEAALEMSELESSSDDEEGGGNDEDGEGKGRGRGKKGKKGRRGRGRDSDDDFDARGAAGEMYSRSDCFKVEKNLLVYGWGRWTDIVSHGRFKRILAAKDVETIARALLMYSLKVYKGDEKIKEFIWDLISPANDGSLKNHSGLSAPVPRGRKGKNKPTKKEKESEHEIEMAKYHIDPESVLKDTGYKRHLHRHANKVLLRVRLLYYLREEIIGHAADKINKGLDVSEIDIPRANVEGDPPTLWWDGLSDRSLLIGVFKHGYEKYNRMRNDPLLCFLSRCGPPAGAALAAEQNDDDDDDMDDTKGNISTLKDEDEDTCTSVISNQDSNMAKETPNVTTEGGDDDGEKLPWPTMSDLNTRLRRIITSFQRSHKRQMLKDAQRAKRMERRERYDVVSRYKDEEKIQYQQSFFGCWDSHWTRREESDFYRIISTFGVEFDLFTGRYKWDRFRTLARLEKKHDDTLTEYFQAFYHMCMRVCKKFKNDDDALPPNNIYVEPISEERASRSLARIDLLNKIRTETLAHPKFDERVKLCQTSYDLPSWWICGKHDKDLLRGAARHGVVRTDEFILNDPALSFKDVFRNKRPYVNSPHFMQSPGASQTPVKVKNKEEETELEIKAMIEKIKRESNKDKPESDPQDVKKEQTSPDKKSDDLEHDLDKDMKKEVNSPDKKTNDSEQDEEEENRTSSPDSNKELKKDIKTEVKVESESDIKEEANSDQDCQEKSEDLSVVKKSVVDNDDDEATDIEHDVSDNETTNDTEVKSEDQNDSEKSPVKVKSEKSPEKVKSPGDIKTEDEEKDSEDLYTEVKKEKVKEEDSEKFTKEDVELQKLINEEDNLDPRLSAIPADFLQWPKDRVIFHRLEHICYCVETGEWPFPKRMSNIPMNYDSRSATPLGSSTPRDDQDLSQSDAGDSVYDGIKVNTGDGLKMTFHKRNAKEQKFDGRMAHLLNQSAAGSSDNDSQSESLTPRSQVPGHSPRHSPHHYFFSQTPADLLSNGSGPEFDPVLLQRSMMEHALMFPGSRQRRGRKRKAEKMAELAMQEALARREHSKNVVGHDPESRVPVINLEDGSRLSGDEAPQKKDLEKWLDEHPGYMIADCEEDFYDDIPRRGRKSRLDPSMIDPMMMTGEENVSVVNRITGKKITGAKAPPLKYLTEWLEQNPLYDVDSKWSDIVRSKVNLPKSLQSRVVTPSRGRKPKDTLSSSMMGSDIPFSAASLAGLSGFHSPGLMSMSGLPKLPLGMPFGALPNFGLGNPLLGMAGYLPGLTASHSKDTESSSKDRKSPKCKESSKSESKSPSIPHPSFPFMYNPMLLNPLFAAQAQSLGFSLPTSLPTSFGALAHSGLMNGSTADSDLEEGEIKRFSQKERRGSSSGLQDAPQDLSVKAKHHHEGGSKHRREKKHSSHSSDHHDKSSSASKQYSASIQQDEPTDLSMKSKPSTPDSAKSKPKIQSSFKLSKIVDTLKDKVNKMEDRSRKDRKSKLDSILNKLVEDKELGGQDRKSVDEDGSVDLSIGSDTKCDDISKDEEDKC
ncbi:chromodomain-helicase-DNA-binding protein 8-like isoform X4 [Mytilus edulis]|uniref:chromodomain-helicase-DNA-binding protein 8-like isoform X4 n=1 Tax=Mytilus edulis TaxID=6550 RepID=UPI0039EF15F1